MRPSRSALVAGRVLLALALLCPVLPGPAAPAGAAAAAVDDEVSGPLYRLYRGFFVREPDVAGFGHWWCLLDKGRRSLADVADAFVGSAEFAADYGDAGGEAFLDLVYRNLFDRDLDESGRRYWLDQLAAGMTRGLVVAHLSGSQEFRDATADGVPPTIDDALRSATTCGPELVVYVPRGLPDGFAEDLAARPEVVAHTTVSGDLLALVQTRSADDEPVQVAPAGWAWPIDAMAIDPASFADLVGGPGHALVASLQPGQAILTESSARLRQLGPGGMLVFDHGAVTVLGVVPDRTGSAAEVLVHRDDAARLGITTERFVVVRDTDRPAVEAAVRALTPPDRAVTMQGSAEVRFLRDADRVDPQLYVKLAYGEFVFQDAGGRSIRIDPAWEAANIVTESVPLLGRVRCHRAVVASVRAALAAVEAAGHGGTVDPAHYAGCYAARRIVAGDYLSRHSWGIALDINVDGSPQGSFATQHPVLVASMRGAGFYWGGDWDNADPAHYEAVAFPR